MTEEGLGKRLGPSMAYRQPAAAILEQPLYTGNCHLTHEVSRAQ
jgi:hypothetical protein